MLDQIEQKGSPDILIPSIPYLKGEEWRLLTHKEYEGKYWISNLARVLSFRSNLPHGRLLNPTPTQYGALKVTFRIRKYNGEKTYKNVYLKNVVAEMFIPNPNGWTYVHHKDGDKGNCRTGNLCWCKNRIKAEGLSSRNLSSVCLGTNDMPRKKGEIKPKVNKEQLLNSDDLDKDIVGEVRERKGAGKRCANSLRTR